MMRGVMSMVLVRVSAGMGLLAVIVALMIWPARGLLTAIWPAPLAETLILASDTGVQRFFHPAGSEPPTTGTLVARSHPLSLVWLKPQSGSPVAGYLLGVRFAAPDGPLLSVPPWLDQPVVSQPFPESLILVLQTAAGHTVEVAGDELQRLVQPNRLSLVERIRLCARRFAERWRWPATGRAGQAG